MTIVIELLLVTGTAIFIGYPLFRNKYRKPDIDMTEDGLYHKLIVNKESIDAAISEIDFDYRTGKLSEEDYHELKDRYETEAISIQKEIKSAKGKGIGSRVKGLG
ncbi:MAG: hypothetical protein ACC630_02980 [Nitrospinota bacterium]